MNEFLTDMKATENNNLEKLLSWARYLYWADIHRKSYIDYGNYNVIGEGAAAEWKLFAALSQWLASVWVVVEGWRHLAIKDSIIDGLLDEWPHYCELLRRYRNGVFHYQPELLDERFTAYATEGSDFIMWVFALYLEFQRFLWEWPDHFK